MIRSERDTDAARHGQAMAFPGRTGASGQTGSAVAAATERFAAMRDQIIPRAAARAFQHPSVSAAAQRAAELAESARAAATGGASADATDIDESTNAPVGRDAKVATPRLEEATQMVKTSWLPKAGQVVSTIAAALASAAQSAPSGASSAKDRVAALVTASLGGPEDTGETAAPVTATKGAADSAEHKGSAWRRVAALGLIAAAAAALVKVIRDSRPQHDPWATPLEPDGARGQVSRRPYDPADAGPAAARAVVKERVTTAAEAVKERSAETVETVKDKVTAVTDTAKERSAETVETVKDKVTAVTETAKERSAETVETVKDKVTAATETAKETASHARSTVAERVEHLKSRSAAHPVSDAHADAADLAPAVDATEPPATDSLVTEDADDAAVAIDIDGDATDGGADRPEQT